MAGVVRLPAEGLSHPPTKDASGSRPADACADVLRVSPDFFEYVVYKLGCVVYLFRTRPGLSHTSLASDRAFRAPSPCAGPDLDTLISRTRP